MAVQRISLASSVAAAFGLGLAVSGAAWAQAPRGPGPGQRTTPEEVIEMALQKIETGDFQEAATLVQRARMLKPTLDKIKLAEGLLGIETGNKVEAIGKLEAYNNTVEGRNDYRGYAAIGRIYRDSRMPRQAVPALREAKKLAPLEKDGRPLKAEIAVDLAMVYYRLGRKDKAIETAREAGQLAPDDPKVQLRLAQAAGGTEDYDTASKAVERAINLVKAQLRTNPLNKENYQVLRSCHQLAMNLQGQENAARPNDSLPFFNMAVIAREDAEAGKRIGLLNAREYALEALAREPGNHQWKVFVARLEAELGAMDQARKRLDDVLASDPNNEEANRLRENIQTGSSRPGTG